MRYIELSRETKQEIADLVLGTKRLVIPEIAHNVFYVNQDFDHTKFFLIGVNEVTKNENVIGKFHALELPPEDEHLILFEATEKYWNLSGFVECLTTSNSDADESDLDVIIIHPFDNRQKRYIKIARSEIVTFPMTILLCDKYTHDATVIDHITKEHWTLMCKRFRGFINVLL